MSDVQSAIDGIRLAIAAAEALLSAMDKAKKTLSDSTDQLKALASQIEKDRDAMHEKLAHDRKEERDAFDKKFASVNAGDDDTKP